LQADREGLRSGDSQPLPWTGQPVINSAISAIEITPWDISGKYYDAPIYRLLRDPCRNRVRCYTSTGEDNREELANNVERAMDEGFTGVKFMAYWG